MVLYCGRRGRITLIIVSLNRVRRILDSLVLCLLGLIGNVIILF
jgi:hypothetical protein